jgi:hypothetical protein
MNDELYNFISFLSDMTDSYTNLYKLSSKSKYTIEEQQTFFKKLLDSIKYIFNIHLTTKYFENINGINLYEFYKEKKINEYQKFFNIRPGKKLENLSYKTSISKVDIPSKVDTPVKSSIFSRFKIPKFIKGGDSNIKRSNFSKVLIPHITKNLSKKYPRIPSNTDRILFVLPDKSNIKISPANYDIFILDKNKSDHLGLSLSFELLGQEINQNYLNKYNKNKKTMREYGNDGYINDYRSGAIYNRSYDTHFTVQ